MTGLPQKQRFCGTRFRFPPSLKNPISLKRPRPGAAAPALDPAPAGRKPGNFSLFTIHYSLTDSTVLLKPGGRPFSLAAARPASSSWPKSRRFAPVGLETRLRAQPRQRRGSHGCGAHRGSGSGKRRVGHSGLYQPCTRLPPCRKPSCRSTGPSSSAPKPLLLLHRARRSSSSLREEEEGGA